MSEMQLGVVQPQNIQKAVNLGHLISSNKAAAGRAQAMARHPAAGGRSQEFHSSAQTHLNAAASNQATLNSMVTQGESGVYPVPGSDSSTAQYN